MSAALLSGPRFLALKRECLSRVMSLLPHRKILTQAGKERKSVYVTFVSEKKSGEQMSGRRANWSEE